MSQRGQRQGQGQGARLPRRFAIAVDSHLTFLYCVEKILLEEKELYDISKFSFSRHVEDGELKLDDEYPPMFSKEVVWCDGELIEIRFCIVPLLFRTRNHKIYPVVIIENFHRIQRFFRIVPSKIYQVIEEWRIRDLLGYLYEQFDEPHYMDRRWPNGLLPYPNDYNLDFLWHRQRVHLDDYDDYTPPPQRRQPQPQEEPEPQPSVVTPKPPPMPSERVALALARDSVSQGEVCPITQYKLQGTKIGVTGCLCVFQGEALEKYSGTKCPSCRTPLTVRYISLSISDGSDGTENTDLERTHE